MLLSQSRPAKMKVWKKAVSASALTVTHSGPNHVELQEHAQVDRPSVPADTRFNSTSSKYNFLQCARRAL